MFAAIIGVFLIPNIALAKKSHQHSSDDGDISSSPSPSSSSPPSTTTIPGGDAQGSAQEKKSSTFGKDLEGADNAMEMGRAAAREDFMNGQQKTHEQPPSDLGMAGLLYSAEYGRTWNELEHAMQP